MFVKLGVNAIIYSVHKRKHSFSLFPRIYFPFIYYHVLVVPCNTCVNVHPLSLLFFHTTVLIQLRVMLFGSRRRIIIIVQIMLASSGTASHWHIQQRPKSILNLPPFMKYCILQQIWISEKWVYNNHYPKIQLSVSGISHH